MKTPKSFSYEEVLEKAKGGIRPSEDVITNIERQLRGEVPAEADEYLLLLILAESNCRDRAELIQTYFHHSEEMLRRVALEILGNYWHDQGVLPLAIQMLKEDPSKYVRAMAASVLGTLGSSSPSTQVRKTALRAILENFLNEAAPEFVRSACYDSVLEIMGIPIQEWPTATRPLNLRTHVDWELIRRAQAAADT